MMFGNSKPEPVKPLFAEKSEPIKPLFAEKSEPKPSLFGEKSEPRPLLTGQPVPMPEPKPLLGFDKDPGKPAKNLFPQQPSDS